VGNKYLFLVVSGSSNLGSAVGISMNLTNSSEPVGHSGLYGAYKTEWPHDMMYSYQLRTLTETWHPALLISGFLKFICSSGIIS
jgi:hypothetical protein